DQSSSQIVSKLRFARRKIAFRSAEGFSNTEIVFWLARSARIDPNSASGGEIANVPVDRKRFRYAAQDVETDPPGRLRIPRYVAPDNERLDLRGKSQRAAVVGIIEWFDAVRISREKKPLLIHIPNSECEHAT